MSLQTCIKTEVCWKEGHPCCPPSMPLWGNSRQHQQTESFQILVVSVQRTIFSLNQTLSIDPALALCNWTLKV